jgi:hypothetical protein
LTLPEVLHRSRTSKVRIVLLSLGLIRTDEKTVVGKKWRGQRAEATINPGWLAGCHFKCGSINELGAVGAMGGYACIDRHYQQYGAQEHRCKTSEQEHFFLHVKIPAFCPFFEWAVTHVFYF